MTDGNGSIAIQKYENKKIRKCENVKIWKYENMKLGSNEWIEPLWLVELCCYSRVNDKTAALTNPTRDLTSDL